MKIYLATAAMLLALMLLANSSRADTKLENDREVVSYYLIKFVNGDKSMQDHYHLVMSEVETLKGKKEEVDKYGYLKWAFEQYYWNKIGSNKIEEEK